jgi:hypothetical protein
MSRSMLFAAIPPAILASFLVARTLPPPPSFDRTPRIASADDPEFDLSILSIKASLPDDLQRLNFAADCEALAAGAATEAEIHQRLGGLTVAQVHGKAQAIRDGLQQELVRDMDRRMVLAADRPAILATAIEGIRRATSGADPDGSAPPVITSGLEAVRDVNGYTWDVSGAFVGRDIQGKEARADWTARVDVSSEGLRCRKIRWGSGEWLP